jgi:hypothetical protein
MPNVLAVRSNDLYFALPNESSGHGPQRQVEEANKQ